MENAELQNIWKSMDAEINLRSKDELNLLLQSKARQTLNKFLAIVGISVLTSTGVIVFLIITTSRRYEDLWYVLNNSALGLLTLTALISGLWSWKKFQLNPLNQSLREWLSERIGLLSGWLRGKRSQMYLFLIPILYVLTILSIHVYFENKPMVEVLQNEESIMGLIVGSPIGLLVSYLVVSKIRKYQRHHLHFLEDLHERLGKG